MKTPKGKRLGYMPQGTGRIVSRRPCQLRSPDGTIRDDGGSLTLTVPVRPPPTFFLWMPWAISLYDDGRIGGQQAKKKKGAVASREAG